jgi:two-component system, NarL family, capsular synthesis sensor histidine kinase RcsC
MADKTILIIDDDPDQAELLAQMVSHQGRRVHAYSDPIRALAALTHDGADLLIADLSMPWIGGEDVIASARGRWPDLRIFLVSGYPRGAEIAAREGLRFFAKPVNFDLLRQAVDQVLAG